MVLKWRISLEVKDLKKYSRSVPARWGSGGNG